MQVCDFKADEALYITVRTRETAGARSMIEVHSHGLMFGSGTPSGTAADAQASHLAEILGGLGM